MKAMAKSDFTTTLLVDETPKEVFNAINNVRAWWGEGLEGTSDKVNSEFIYRHKDIHYSKQKVTELVPGKKVVWLVTDSELNFVKDKTEWTGTKVVFEITKKGDKTEMRFTHEGLVPGLQCYEGCSSGWSYYITGSLKKLITTGKGEPDPAEVGRKTASDFTATILVDQTPKQAFDAINNPRAWWSEAIEGSTSKLNDEFFYQYKDIHLCKMKLIELIPGKKVVWLVLDNYFKFTKDKSEWKGTKVIFDIAKKGNKTQITFTHEGLVPQYECYEICREAWTQYIMDSLRNLIATGKGQPNKKEDGYDTQFVEKWRQGQTK